MGVKLAKAFDADLRLFHVVEPEPSYTAYGFTPEEFPAMTTFRDEAKRRAAMQMENLLATLRAEVPTVGSEIVEGSPIHSLLVYVERVSADLLIIGSHGHGVIASLLLGNVAEGMIRKAAVPTLVVPAIKE